MVCMHNLDLFTLNRTRHELQTTHKLAKQMTHPVSVYTTRTLHTISVQHVYLILFKLPNLFTNFNWRWGTVLMMIWNAYIHTNNDFYFTVSLPTKQMYLCIVSVVVAPWPNIKWLYPRLEFNCKLKRTLVTRSRLLWTNNTS